MSLKGGILFVVLSTALAGCHLIFQYEDDPGSDGAPALDQALADKKVLPGDKKVPPKDKASLPPDNGAAFCGDGLKQAGEPCDYGIPLNSELPDAPCRTTCVLPYCGDKVVDQGRGEQCDGNANVTCNKSSCKLATPTLLSPDPVAIHFGAVGYKCSNSTSRTLHLVNPSAKDIVLKTVATDDCKGAIGVSTQMAGKAIKAGSKGAITVTLTPKSLGIISCDLVITAADGKVVVPVTANVTNKLSHSDHFLQDHKRPVDLLMLVDNSGSMFDQKAAVDASAAPLAVQALKYNTDLHLGAVLLHQDTTNLPGALFGAPAYLTSSTVSEAKIKARLPVSYAGTNINEAFRMVWAALVPPLTVDFHKGCGAGCPKGSVCTGAVCVGVNKGFRRAHADLALMVFVDGDDKTSTITGTQFVEDLRSQVNPLLGQIVRVQALLELSGCGASKSLSSYPKWVGVITKQSGAAKNLCSATLTSQYTTLAADVMGPRRWFRLTRTRNVSAGSLNVVVDGVTLKDSEYVWKAGGNGILMNSAPAHGSVATVSYGAKCP